METTGRLIIACVVGTRPEAIKMAPVLLALRAAPWADARLVVTAQHREMADEVLSLFGLVPDVDLNLMRPNQSLSELTARAITGLDQSFATMKPHAVVAQGDTTTVMTSSLVAFYRRIPFLHVEAGLRSGDLDNPFPEELNRIVADRVSDLMFAPTEGARQHLLKEGMADSRIVVTGNTVIDALRHTAARELPLRAHLDPTRRMVLVTCHRRENFGAPLQGICGAIEELLDRHPDIEVLWPVHPNPNVAEVVRGRFAGRDRIHLTSPLPYGEFVAAMKRAYLILSDSGGVQEEAPALAKPVLVLRRETERPEAIAEGVVALVGTELRAIADAAHRLLDDAQAYARMATGASPYGDGRASERIAAAIRRRFPGAP